jgi:hypothetical protein
MIRIIHIPLLLITAVMLSSCSGLNYWKSRKISTIGLIQKNEYDSSGKLLKRKGDCPNNERIYYYRDADVAICLPDIMVSYTHCVTELIASNSHSVLTNKSTANLEEVIKGVKIGLTDDQIRDLTKAFADSGAIGNARAEAIKTCKVITDEVYGGKLAPNIKQAEYKYIMQNYSLADKAILKKMFPEVTQ